RRSRGRRLPPSARRDRARAVEVARKLEFGIQNLEWVHEFQIPNSSFLIPRSGMRFAIHVQQLRGVDVRVALRRAEARVAQELLNGAQIGAALQQMRRERMAQRV